MTDKLEKTIFAAGCFWGVEDAFRKLNGVVDAVSGYSGGQTQEPTYEQVCTGNTGHAEVVEVTFDPKRVSYGQLLERFWKIHDPTTLNRQGPDVGNQYRSAIFYTNNQQRVEAEESLSELEHSDKYKDLIVTEISPAGPFYRAEEYHQRYVEKHGVGACHI